ncbi:MAG TPA: hypothetical protein VKR78_01045 [Acidimicrobiales bacterium]|nr:hypothetical protein [Acidimicrobiales bacterium]
MSPFWLLGLAAAGAGVYYLTQSKTASASTLTPAQQQAAAETAFLQQAASYGMSGSQIADAQSLGLSPYEYMSTLAANGQPPTATISPPSTATSAGPFFDPLSGASYGGW